MEIKFEDITIHPLSSGANEVLFFYEGKLFRAPHKLYLKRHYILMDSPTALQKIKETNFVLNHPQHGHLNVFELTKHDHLVSIAESSLVKRVEFLKTICKTNMWLMERGYVLRDVHENNIFDSIDGIIWLDWGAVSSIIKDDDLPWTPSTVSLSNAFYMAHKYVYNLLGPKTSHLRYDLFVAEKENSPIASIASKNPKDINTWELLVQKLSAVNPTSIETHWADVYSPHLSADNIAVSSPKGTAAANFIDQIQYNTVTDVGCNKGYYTLYAAKKARSAIGFDVDEKCIAIANGRVPKEMPVLFAYKDIRDFIEFDINNTLPSAIFIDNKMRQFSEARYSSDLVMALAIVHHIGKLIPHTKFAEILMNLSKKYILIEDIETKEIYQKEFEDNGFYLVGRTDSFPKPRTMSLYCRK